MAVTLQLMSSPTPLLCRSKWPLTFGRQMQLLILGGALAAQAQLVEPMLPVMPSEPDGFFPTLNDTTVLRG
jgi:hypothetical protein